jgi:hypothetical protein
MSTASVDRGPPGVKSWSCIWGGGVRGGVSRASGPTLSRRPSRSNAEGVDKASRSGIDGIAFG